MIWMTNHQLAVSMSTRGGFALVAKHWRRGWERLDGWAHPKDDDNDIDLPRRLPAPGTVPNGLPGTLA